MRLEWDTFECIECGRVNTSPRCIHCRQEHYHAMLREPVSYTDEQLAWKRVRKIHDSLCLYSNLDCLQLSPCSRRQY